MSESEIAALEARLIAAAQEHPVVPLGPEWWQERMLDWASHDPDFRTKLLRFVDVLPTLRTPAAVGEHVRLYFRDAAPASVRLGSEIASQPLLRPMLSGAVRQTVFAISQRFIAGAIPQQALPHLRELAREGAGYSIDLLGEATLSQIEANAYLARYLALLDTLAARRTEVAPVGDRWQGVPAVNLSIKLSALCPHFEPAAPDYVLEELREPLRTLFRAARNHGAYLHFDMEQFRFIDLTHHVFEAMVTDPEFVGWPDVGIVLQAYLRTAEEDLERLRAVAERREAPFTIRLVKGAYWDEERVFAGQNGWPVPVYEEKADTDASYERCTDSLLDAWPHLRPAFGTHNPRSVAQAAVKAGARGLSAPDVEFQMLYGMAEDIRAAVHAEGFRTRVYVPVGEIIPGMGYLVRRLLENSSNLAWFRAMANGHAEHRVPVNGPLTLSLSKGEPLSYSREDGFPQRFQNAPPARFHEPEPRSEMKQALAIARKTHGARYSLLIGEKHVTDRDLAEVRYPADHSLLVGHVAQATTADVDTAVAIARKAQPGWRDRGAGERAAVLRRAADLLDTQRYELAAGMVYESAKPWHEADGDVTEAIDYLRYYAAEAERLEQPVRLGGLPGEENEYFHEARGVAAIIAPWNFPLAITTGMASAALAAGNAAILKPAEQSPIIAFRLVELLREAGVPPEVVHYLPGPGEEVGRALTIHPGIDVIAFTGSSGVGLSILEEASKVRPGQRNIKRIIAEMGGKNALIIDDDADLDQALAGTLTSAFGFAGQKCSACSRLIVVGSAWDQVLERLKSAIDSLVVGPPHDPATFVPPVISAESRDRIMGYIEGAQATGAKLVAQGKPPGGAGYYVPPTVFTDVAPDSALAKEEVFGPVLAMFHARDFDEALATANDSAFALTGGLFSRNPRDIEVARREFRTGNLYINRKITGAQVARQPFGGLAMSGYGEKAGGPDCLRQFMQPRVVTENTMRRGFAPEDA